MVENVPTASSPPKRTDLIFFAFQVKLMTSNKPRARIMDNIYTLKGDNDVKIVCVLSAEAPTLKR